MALALSACGGVEHQPVDLQLDLPGALPLEAEQVRVCVEGVGERVAGARITGRVLFTGLPAGRAAEVTVDALGAEGEVLAQWTGAEVWGHSEGEAVPCAPDTGWPDCAPCAAQGRLAPEGEDWVMAVRFLEAP